MKPLLNDWLLELGTLGKLSEKEQIEFENRLRENPELWREVERIKQSDQEIRRQYPVAAEIINIIGRFERELLTLQKKNKGITVPWRRYGFVAALVMIAFSLSIWIIWNKRQIQASGNQTRAKGTIAAVTASPQFLIFRKKNGQAERLQSPAVIQAGDILQLAYQAGSARYGTIFSIDGNGVITLHFPYHENDLAVLEQNGWVNLQNANRMDEAPGFEHFFFITSQTTMNIQPILIRARELAKDAKKARQGNLGLPQAYQQQSILLLKK